MTLTVLNVAYSLATVGSDSVGGAEQVLTAIDRALVVAGATSIVIACEGSRTRGLLHTTPRPTGALDTAGITGAREAHARAIAEALDRYPVDVLHFHGVDFHSYLPEPGVAALATLHLAHCWYPAHAIAPTRPHTFVQCVSEWQRQFFPTSPAMLPTIANGVPIPAEPVKHRRAGYAMALGRICPEKGFHIALDVAKRAGVPMQLAGCVFPYPEHERYFVSQIAPRLDDARQFIGPVGPRRKQALLADARCLLLTSHVPETSSLVAMEALAAGTPVIAFPSGALVEIIDHGVTGFFVHEEREMADAIAAAGELDPELCRATARARFSVETMERKYLTLYDALTARRNQHPGSSFVPKRMWTRDVVEVRSEHAFRELAPEWQRLCSTAECTPFQRPEWLLPWWRHFEGNDLRALIVRRGGRLVGLAPLYLRRGWQDDRELALVGAGNTDYLDVVAIPEFSGEVASAAVDYIITQASDWDRCDLAPLSARSPLLAVLMPNGWHAPRERMDVCPVLCIGSPRGNILDVVSPRLLARLDYARRRAAREHDVQVHEATASDASLHLAELTRLHAARWRARDMAGVLDDQRTRAFHEDVVRGMAGAGVLRMYLLTMDGQAAASFYGFADRQRWYYYLGGFDPAFARHSVGSLVMLHALERAARQHATEFNFLRGPEPYKYRWGAVDGALFRCEIRPTAMTSARLAAS